MLCPDLIALQRKESELVARLRKMDALRFPDRVIRSGGGVVGVVDLEQTRLACYDWSTLRAMTRRYSADVTLGQLIEELEALVDANNHLAT